MKEHACNLEFYFYIGTIKIPINNVKSNLKLLDLHDTAWQT
jgi:hypothetical protein